MDKNSCVKPLIKKDKENKERLYIDILNKEEKVKLLNCLLDIKINYEFKIPFYVECYVIPFMFELEVYNYNIKNIQMK